jgi:cytochrome c553
MTRVGLAVVVATAVLAFHGGALAYLWLPSVQLPGQTWFEAWCSALGVPRQWIAPGNVGAPAQASEVVLTHALTADPSASDVGTGATLALRCTMCHGPTGLSYANSPNLAGQYAAVTYKQLRDYRSGARASPIMTAMAQTLSDEQMRQLAAYYASLPRLRPAPHVDDMPAIVRWGAPMRNIAPCGSCHGGIDHTMASPWLYGAPKEYLRTQLIAFARGERTNDINGQMRVMARALSPAEIDQAAEFYGGSRVE